MRLVSTVFGFLLRKLGLFALLLLSLFVGYLLLHYLVPTLQEAVEERERLESVATQREKLEADLAKLERASEESRSKAVHSLRSDIEAEVESGRSSVSKKKSDIERLRKEKDDVCGFWSKVASAIAPGNACKDAQRAVDAADKALDTFEKNLGSAERDAAILSDPELTNEQKLERLGGGGDGSVNQREIDNKESELDQTKAEERSLRKSQQSWAGWVVNRWSQSWKWLVGLTSLILLLPPLLRTIGYFVLMPLVSRAHNPIHLAGDAQKAATHIETGPSQRTLPVRLAAGEVLSARSEHLRPVRGTKVRSGLLYDWSSPFISFAAGLYGLSRVTGDAEGTEATLATPDDPNSYLMRIDFRDHPGLVMHPKHVVGVIGRPELRTRWRWGLHSFVTWQVRYIMFAGSGGLIVQGSGDVATTSPGGGVTKMEQHLVMGFDSRLTVGINRTEVFWPYLSGRTPLVDDEFSGSHSFFWQKSTAEETSTPIAKVFNAFFSGIGKLLGF